MSSASPPAEPPERPGRTLSERRARDRPARLPRRRRAEAMAALLPLAGLFLLMPPFLGVFAHDGRTFGAPSALVFIGAVWLALILGARRLARRLAQPGPDGR